MAEKNLEKLAEIGERKLLENLNPRIETKISVRKIMKDKYKTQTRTYAQINQELNIPRY